MNHRRVARSIAFAAVFAAACAVPAFAQCDTTPPNLTGFSFTPSSVNTTSTSQTVTCTMNVTDDLSGAASATCSFTSPSFTKNVSCSASSPTSGTPLNGTWSCTLTLPRYAEAGVWSANVSLEDAVGNSEQFDPFILGFPDSLTVTSDPDTIAPALTSFSFAPTAVTVSAGAQNVTCTMVATDAKSGVNTATCAFAAPNSSQSRGCAAIAPSSGTRNNGTFQCTFSMPQYSDAGAWVPSVFLSDVVGNFAVPPVTGTLTVTSVPEDVTSPSMTSFDFNPKSIDVGSASKQVTCTFNVADSPAGVSNATCSFTYTDPFNPFVTQSQSCTATTPTSGTRNSGTFQCVVTIPRYSAGGAWTVDAQLVDAVGNSGDFPQAQTLAVACAGAEAETTVNFSDKTTLTWTAVAGATQYDVYRGQVSGLVDTNADHLPDGGYGTCQNSRDGNVTDTVFVDTDVPSAVQKGFHYLVAYKIGGLEKGLGQNSFGTARTVVSVCP